MKALYAGLGVLAVAAVVLVGSYFSAANRGNKAEAGIEAQYQQNQNQYSAFTQTAVEQMGVADRYKDGLQEVITAALQGRYGADGAGAAAVQAIQERYPGEFDNTLFLRIQNTIESGRRDFAQEQKLLIDRVRGYRVDLGSAYGGAFMRMAGYPREEFDFARYQPVVSGNTKRSYDSGIDQGIQFNK